MEEEINSQLHKGRNKVLIKFADQSFSSALEEINSELATEKNHTKKLALLSAKSWVLRNKLYASIHDPYIYSLNEVENTDVFDDMDDEEDSEIDNLFDEEKKETMIEVIMLKNATLNGTKLVKGAILSVTQDSANKLIDDGKAKLSGEK
ncbi:hypothetical protein N8714_03965 [Rhodobacteraceae bacterium]|nr:hypothetical protein [Paracoccaceae bacterium]|tara:strand:- start:3 stop:449 length:447 start_codon:yes stop_codon:yes gene_type:complete